MSKRRWDNDTREVGVANGQPVATAIQALFEACRVPGWVTEDAEAHLGVHLGRRCEERGSPWTWIEASQGDDGVYEIELSHSATGRPTEIWRDAVALLSTIAEQSIHVRRVDDQTFEAITGMLPGDADFASHGHTVRLRIRSHSAGDGPAYPDWWDRTNGPFRAGLARAGSRATPRALEKGSVPRPQMILALRQAALHGCPSNSHQS